MPNFLSNNLNSKGAVSIFLVMSILAAILAIALGSAVITSSQARTASGFNESMVAYYAAETGLEKAMFEKLKGNTEPTAKSCAIIPPAIDCACPVNWEVLGNAQYCLKITETTAGVYTTITNIQSIGDYKSTRRSMEISF